MFTATVVIVCILFTRAEVLLLNGLNLNAAQQYEPWQVAWREGSHPFLPSHDGAKYTVKIEVSNPPQSSPRTLKPLSSSEPRAETKIPATGFPPPEPFPIVNDARKVSRHAPTPLPPLKKRASSALVSSGYFRAEERGQEPRRSGWGIEVDGLLRRHGVQVLRLCAVGTEWAAWSTYP